MIFIWLKPHNLQSSQILIHTRYRFCKFEDKIDQAIYTFLFDVPL